MSKVLIAIVVIAVAVGFYMKDKSGDGESMMQEASQAMDSAGEMMEKGAESAGEMMEEGTTVAKAKVEQMPEKFPELEEEMADAKDATMEKAEEVMEKGKEEAMEKAEGAMEEAKSKL